ncbi:MAG: hypothetical protein RSD63_06215 [Eubacterium sp.]
MSIAYLITQNEFSVLRAMVCKREWEGSPEDLNTILTKLSSKGYLFQKNKNYTIDRVIYGLIRVIEKTPTESILTDGVNCLYENQDLCIFMEKDEHSKINYKLKPFQGKISFEESEEGKKFLKVCNDE